MKYIYSYMSKHKWSILAFSTKNLCASCLKKTKPTYIFFNFHWNTYLKPWTDGKPNLNWYLSRISLWKTVLEKRNMSQFVVVIKRCTAFSLRPQDKARIILRKFYHFTSRKKDQSFSMHQIEGIWNSFVPQVLYLIAVSLLLEYNISIREHQKYMHMKDQPHSTFSIMLTFSVAWYPGIHNTLYYWEKSCMPLFNCYTIFVNLCSKHYKGKN